MIRPSKLYNTGFLLDDSVSRMLQGLDPQGLSSYCYIYMPENALESNPYYNNVQFPILGLSPDNSSGSSLSASCPCLQKLYGTIGNDRC